MDRLPPGVVVGVLLRSTLLQAAWNYRTLQGAGVAFALMPVLRHVHRDPGALSEAVQRHARHFNAHPYLASLALGSLARLEADAAGDETIRRFQAALGGPLGALGDRLVWAAWLPFCSVVGLILHWLGVAPVSVLAVFLTLYNLGHLGLRVWGFREGWAAGTGLAARLRTMGLAGVALRLEGWLAAALGVLVGLALVAPGVRSEVGIVWTGAGVGVLLAGVLLGPRAWRATAAVTVTVVGVLTAAGFMN